MWNSLSLWNSRQITLNYSDDCSGLCHLVQSLSLVTMWSAVKYFSGVLVSKILVMPHTTQADACCGHCMETASLFYLAFSSSSLDKTSSQFQIHCTSRVLSFWFCFNQLESQLDKWFKILSCLSVFCCAWQSRVMDLIPLLVLSLLPFPSSASSSCSPKQTQNKTNVHF